LEFAHALIIGSLEGSEAAGAGKKIAPDPISGAPPIRQVPVHRVG